MILLKIAFGLAVLAPLPVAVPLLAMGHRFTADSRLVRWADARLDKLAIVVVAAWTLALVSGALGLVR